MANAQYIDYDKANRLYSPGLASNNSAEKGEKGNTGDRGYGLFFFPNIISGNDTNFKYVKNRLENNTSITGGTETIFYKDYDMIMDSYGDIYYYKDIKNAKTADNICIGNLRLSSGN